MRNLAVLAMMVFVGSVQAQDRSREEIFRDGRELVKRLQSKMSPRALKIHQDIMEELLEEERAPGYDPIKNTPVYAHYGLLMGDYGSVLGISERIESEYAERQSPVTEKDVDAMVEIMKGSGCQKVTTTMYAKTANTLISENRQEQVEVVHECPRGLQAYAVDTGDSLENSRIEKRFRNEGLLPLYEAYRDRFAPRAEGAGYWSVGKDGKGSLAASDEAVEWAKKAVDADVKGISVEGAQDVYRVKISPKSNYRVAVKVQMMCCPMDNPREAIFSELIEHGSKAKMKFTSK